MRKSQLTRQVVLTLQRGKHAFSLSKRPVTFIKSSKAREHSRGADNYRGELCGGPSNGANGIQGQNGII